MKTLLLAIGLLMLGAPAWGGTYITTGANAGTMLEDAELDGGATTTKKGGNTTMRYGEDLTPNNINLWLDCPSAADSIPAGSTIDSLTISLQITSMPFSALQVSNADFFDVSQTVVEADVTWDKYDATNNWTTPGGDGTSIQTSGLKLTVIKSFNDSVRVDQAWDGNSQVDTLADKDLAKVVFHVPVSLAADILSRTSKGINLKNNISTNSVAFVFASSENATSANRPIWSWYYSAPATYETNQTDAAAQIDDTYLRENSPTTTSGLTTVLSHGEPVATKARHLLIRDNLVKDSVDAALGGAAIIDSCFVDLVFTNNGSMDVANDSIWFDLYSCDENWTEDSVSWNQAQASTPWTTAGGTKTLLKTGYGRLLATDAGINFSLDIDWGGGTYTETGTFNNTKVSFRIPTAAAQDMYSGAIFGWFLSVVDKTKTQTEESRFGSTESATTTTRPTIRWYAHLAPSSSPNTLHSGRVHAVKGSSKIHSK